MARAAKPKKEISMEEALWKSADKLRGSVEPAEYKHVVLSLFFLKFASDKFEVIDNENGECRSVEMFVSILPCSHYTYCEAVWSQSKQDLIKACENALHFYGGIPMAIVPDNLKAAVARSDHNGPVINEEFAAFSEHYGCTVYPARVRHPKDKALVENAVKLLYRQYMQMSKSLCSTCWNL